MTHTQTGERRSHTRKLLRFSQMSEARKHLVRLCQTINYGQILKLDFSGGEPLFHPVPVVLLDLKLDIEEYERPEVDLADFVLSEENHRLFAKMDTIRNGRMERIEVRAGIPRRVLIERQLSEGLR